MLDPASRVAASYRSLKHFQRSLASARLLVHERSPEERSDIPSRVLGRERFSNLGFGGPVQPLNFVDRGTRVDGSPVWGCIFGSERVVLFGLAISSLMGQEQSELDIAGPVSWVKRDGPPVFALCRLEIAICGV